MSMTRKQLHGLIRGSTERLFDAKLKDLEAKVVAITKCPSEKLPEYTNVISNFKIVYKRIWLTCNSTESRFLEKNQDWLNEEVFFTCWATLYMYKRATDKRIRGIE